MTKYEVVIGPIEEDQDCDHSIFSVDTEGNAECGGCDKTWNIYEDKHVVGNINNGTFKIYGKEQPTDGIK